MNHYKIIKINIINIPIPSRISYSWNFGSILLICIISQLIRGIFLVFFYSPDSLNRFNRIIFLIRETNLGWLIRTFHSNIASILFIFIYFHISRNLYFNSFIISQNVWITGVTLLLIITVTAFLGYVLPWGQISYWGAIVITNLVTSIPYIGEPLLKWIWGRFSINKLTLLRFFCFHFIIPFIIILFILIHLFYLHSTGSSNPLGLNNNNDKVYFHPYFSWKDLIGFILIFIILFFLILIKPYLLANPENWFKVNIIITPNHIKPEWYFLYAYAILCSIPNKLGGTVALILAILIYYFLPLLNKNNFKNIKFYPLNKILIILFFINFISLTFIGILPVKEPYIFIRKFFTIFYFIYFLIDFLIKKLWNYWLINLNK